MGRARQAGRARQGGRSQSEAARSLELARLGKRFARFRSQHLRGARYPDELRQAALGLLGEVEPDALYRACGVCFRQVMTWKAARRSAPARALEAEPSKVRVFSVVDPQPGVGAEVEPVGRVAEPELELQIGPWTVSVRLESAQRVRRGRACCP
jgi:hypothetical protein